MYCRPICSYGFVLLLALTFAHSALADAPIGAVTEPNTKDTIALPAAGGAPRDLHYQAAVFRNDTVITRDLGTSLQFTDETLLKVSSNSRVVLDSFVFDPGSGTLDGTVKLGVGVFRLVSGPLVKHDNLQLVTPVTTLTIRGTDLVVSVEEDGTTRLRLYEGSIRVKTCNGATIWMRPHQRIVVSPTCVALVLNTDTDGVIAIAGDGGTSTAASGSGSGTGGGTGTGGGDPGAGGGTGTGGGDPGAGGGTGTGGGDPGAGGDPGPSDGGKDPGNGNGGPGLGNGGNSNGNGNGGDPGNGGGNNPSH